MNVQFLLSQMVSLYCLWLRSDNIRKRNQSDDASEEALGSDGKTEDACVTQRSPYL